MTLRGRIVTLERDEQRRAVERAATRTLTPEEHAFADRLSDRFAAAMRAAETGQDVDGVTLADAEAIAAPLGGLASLVALDLAPEYPPPEVRAAFEVAAAQLQP